MDATPRSLTPVMRFDHPLVEHYSFQEVPLDQDIYLVDEKWLDQYESSLLGLLNGAEYQQVGYVNFAAARKIDDDAIEISWYANVFDRFHEVSVLLPRSEFVLCVGCRDYDEKPRIFVKGSWLEKLHGRPYSTFALIDAIGVKKAMRRGELSSKKLLNLRDRVDELASRNPAVAFISFADSLLLKANWYVGRQNQTERTYEPEILLRLIPELTAIYDEVLGMSIYAVITQGMNEYDEPALLHTSATGNHVALNSLGLPFAQLLSIDTAVRQNLRAKVHGPHQLYIDEHCFNSLQYEYGFQKHDLPRAMYVEPLSSVTCRYIYTSVAAILENLQFHQS